MAPTSNAERYNHLHKIFGQILGKLGPGSSIEKKAASALWLLQLVHQTKIYRPPNSSRVLYCDNFYTRPKLCEKVYEISDGDVRMTGTCKFSNIDAINRPAILDGIQLLKNKPRGAWLLTRTYSNNKEYDKFRKRSPDPNVQSFRIIDDNLIQKNSGFIMFKDAKIVVFYSNDLAATPHQRICESSDERSIFAVRGTVEIERWLGTESIGRSRIECPAIIASYQLFMNGVDRVDQMRSTNPTKRAEKRIHMTIWTYLLDLCVHQAYCVYKVLLCNKKIADAEDMLEDDEDDDDSVVRSTVVEKVKCQMRGCDFLYT